MAFFYVILKLLFSDVCYTILHVIGTLGHAVLHSFHSGLELFSEVFRVFFTEEVCEVFVPMGGSQFNLLGLTLFDFLAFRLLVEKFVDPSPFTCLSLFKSGLIWSDPLIDNLKWAPLHGPNTLGQLALGWLLMVEPNQPIALASLPLGECLNPILQRRSWG